MTDRLHCAAVCTSWRASLADPSLWVRLDLSPDSGVMRRVNAALLFAAAARARGGLQELNVSRCADITRDDLAEVVSDNAASLRVLRACQASGGAGGQAFEPAALETLLSLAPGLAELHADVRCKHSEATPLLLRKGPFRALRLSRAVLFFNDCQDDHRKPVRRLLDDVSAHGSLTELALHDVPLLNPDDVTAVVDCARALRLSALTLDGALHYTCGRRLIPLLQPDSALRLLSLYSKRMSICSTADVDAFSDALQACPLRELTLYAVDIWQEFAVAQRLLTSLAANATLRVLRLCSNDGSRVRGMAAGCALRGLLIANSPSLQELDISCCRLGDVGLREVLKGLHDNTHLRTLSVVGNCMGASAAEGALLPAVRNCGSLRELRIDCSAPDVAEALRLLHERRRADAQA